MLQWRSRFGTYQRRLDELVERKRATMGDIREWLTGLGLERFADGFEREELTPAHLPKLGDGDLKELGLPLGPRKTVLQAIEALRAGGTISLPASSESGTPKHVAETTFAKKAPDAE